MSDTMSSKPGQPNRLTMLAGGHSETGPVRSNNEDCFISDPHDRLCAVADGMGGHIGGEIASHLSIEGLKAGLLNGPPPRRELRSFFSTSVFDELLESFAGNERENHLSAILEPPPTELDRDDEHGDPQTVVQSRERERTRLFQAILEGHVRVLEESRTNPQLSGMGTTIVTAWAPDRDLWIGHVGDCRAYRFFEGAFACLTEDHTPVAQLIRAGRLEPEAEKTHPMRSQLAQAVGAVVPPTPDIVRASLNPGDRFLLCSDGVWGALENEDMAMLLSKDFPPATLARNVVEAAISAGSEDNATAVVIVFE